MSEFVKKNMVGYKPLPGGHSDPECTHVILTLQEYDQLLREKSMAEQEARAARDQAAREVAAADRRASQEAYRAAQEAQEKVEAIRGELEAERAESAHQRELNANLLRISRERANADRKLKPKKEHTGYLVMISGEKELRYKDGNRNLKKALLWETVIQSPYSIEFTEKQARRQIMEELLRKDDESRSLLSQIGIEGLYNKSYGSLLHDRAYCQEPERFNIMLKPKFRANFRAGYWEVVFYHTKPLGSVPKELRPR